MPTFPIKYKAPLPPNPRVSDEKINIGDRRNERTLFIDPTIYPKHPYPPKPVLRDHLYSPLTGGEQSFHEVLRFLEKHISEEVELEEESMEKANTMEKQKIKQLPEAGPEQMLDPHERTSVFPTKKKVAEVTTGRASKPTYEEPLEEVEKQSLKPSGPKTLLGRSRVKAKEGVHPSRKKTMGIESLKKIPTVTPGITTAGARAPGMQNSLEKARVSLKEGTKGRKRRDILAEGLKRKKGIKKPYALATWMSRQKKTNKSLDTDTEFYNALDFLGKVTTPIPGAPRGSRGSLSPQKLTHYAIPGSRFGDVRSCPTCGQRQEKIQTSPGKVGWRHTSPEEKVVHEQYVKKAIVNQTNFSLEKSPKKGRVWCPKHQRYESPKWGRHDFRALEKALSNLNSDMLFWRKVRG